MGLITTPRIESKPVAQSFIKQKPATRPKTGDKPSAKPKKSALEILRLENPKLALLCPPTDFVDCREAFDTVQNQLLNKPTTLFRLRFSGRMTGFSASKSVIWRAPMADQVNPNAVPWAKQKQTRRTEVELLDADDRVVTLTLFSGPFQWQECKVNEEVLVVGEISPFGQRLFLAIEKRPPQRALGSLWAQYSGLHSQVAGERIEALVAPLIDDESAYRECAAEILGATGMTDDALMSACASEDGNRFENSAALLRALHRPATMVQGRLALECAKRISAIAIQAAALRHHVRAPHPKAPLPVDLKSVDMLASHLAVALTQSQIEVARKVTARLCEPTPLTGLLSGDVGTGKTLAFLIPAIAAHLAGARVAIVAPRTLLADQIAEQIIARFDGIVGDVERVSAGGRIKNPNALIVSTSGLASVAAKSGYTPQFLICDEQHKFSAESREALMGPATHLLEVSATPVPRSLAAALYDGMEILNLRECPVEKTIHSYVIDMADRGGVISGIRKALNNGERAAIIYPLVSTADGSEAQSVTRAFESLNVAFPGQAVMMHGEMSDEDMRVNIGLLRSGERRLVVASTVLEIGIDIPSISFLAVRDADRFGISQLHQLRGRLVRNGGEGNFVMVVESLENLPPQTLERLKAVESTTDGYELAELDLVQRGFGEIDGSAQSGDAKTVFRRIQLGVKDFMARKLKTIHVEPGKRTYNQTNDASRVSFQQDRLI